MINFDSLTLKLFTDETVDFFIGAKIQKIQQPNRNELIFHIRNMGETKKFYINFNPNFYHICFMSKENEIKRNITIPKTAPMFCMLLRKYILNCKIIKVDVPKYERIFEIYFEYYDELNEKSELCLAIELMGKYSNVILYNYDTNVIIGCGHNVSSEKSRDRELYGSLPYVYPIKQKKKNLTKTSLESFLNNLDEKDIEKSISSNYYYLTIPIIQEIIAESKTNNDIYNKLKDLLCKKEYEFYIKNDFSSYSVFKTENSKRVNSINDMIDIYFAYHQSEFIKKSIKTKINKIIQTQINKAEKLKEKQEQQISKIAKANEYKNKADIIMANLYSLQKGMKDYNLYNFEGKEITIEADVNLSPIENANRYYNLYKKVKTAYEHANEMLKETISQILYYKEMKYYTEISNTIDDLNDIYKELKGENSDKEEKKEIIESIEYEGVKIYIGKNKKQNDYILSKIAAGEDLWFHPLNAAGSHILLKAKKSNKKIPDKAILKAAQLAKEYSSQKNNSKTSIIYTKRKYVKKANNKIAFVTYRNETEIVV